MTYDGGQQKIVFNCIDLPFDLDMRNNTDGIVFTAKDEEHLQTMKDEWYNMLYVVPGTSNAISLPDEDNLFNAFNRDFNFGVRDFRVSNDFVGNSYAAATIKNATMALATTNNTSVNKSTFLAATAPSTSPFLNISGMPSYVPFSDILAMEEARRNHPFAALNGRRNHQFTTLEQKRQRYGRG
jgi:hypothetical protein